MRAAAVPQRHSHDQSRWWVLAVMSLGTLIVFLDTTVINTALPSIATDLSASTSNLQWVIDGYVLVLAGLLLLAGSVGDRHGRRRAMAVGLVTFAAGSVLGAVAGTIEMLIIARAVQGLGAAFVLPATLSIVTNVFPRSERSKAIAIWTAVSGLGVGLGPAVGGYLVDRYDWSAAFWVHVPVLAIGLLGLAIVPESRDPRHSRLDVPGAIVGTASISTFVYAVIQGGEAGWTSPGIITAFVASLSLLGAFVVIEQRADAPMLPLHFFARRDFTGGVLVLGLMFFAGIVAFFFLTQFFQLVQGRDPFNAGLMILPNALAIMAGSIAATALVHRIGPRRVLVLSLTLMAVGIGLFTTMDASTGTLTIVANILVLGFGFGLGATPLTDTVMAAVPVEDAGIGSAVNDVSRELGSALGVAIVGSFVSGLYRADVASTLEPQVPAELVEAAQEGIGVLGVAAQHVPTDVAAIALAGANQAFVDAMTAGFWLSVAFLGIAIVAAWRLLPDRARGAQVTREEPVLVPVAATQEALEPRNRW